MQPRARRRWRSPLIAVAVLAPVVIAVVHSSLRLPAAECEVCMVFNGREACRTVTAASEEEALRGAIDNACALLASGVTDTLRCARTPPRRAACRPAGADPPR